MTLDEVKNLLSTTQLTVAYDFIPDEKFTGYPIITFREIEAGTFYADGKVYKSFRKIEVELFSKTKDLISEGKVETALSSISWTKLEDYIDGEKCYRVNYTLEV